jgi:hypothetical protein
MKIPKPWWETETYDGDWALGADFQIHAGPQGPALVKAWPNGKTTGGWGDEEFMANYLADNFNARSALYAYKKKDQPFAIVMRSVKMLAVDIDGKNGGLEHAKKLGALPPTLAETSKSGNGYHLFYLVDEEWDDTHGFGSLSDRIGIEQGVDIRVTGCVFHYPQQRWNNRTPAPLPTYLHDLLRQKQQERAHRAAATAAVLDSGDEVEIMMMQDQLISDLAKPIPAGKRNNTLFAIGQQMKLAQVPDWQKLVDDRAQEVGLSTDEADKLVSNIERYQ